MKFERPGKRTQKVWAHVDDDGMPIVERGRVTIRYKVDGNREYSTSPRNLTPVLEAPIVGKGEESSTEKTSSSPASRTKKFRSKRNPAPDEAIDTPFDNVKLVPKPSTIPSSPPDGVILVFTDGACFGNPGPAGAGAVICYGDHQKEISEFIDERGTNNIGELFAIQRALESITKPDRPVHLYTDSSYALGVLAKGWNAKANTGLISNIVDQFARFDDLTLFKVKGHAGFALNEKADELAVAAITERGFSESDFDVGNEGPSKSSRAANESSQKGKPGTNGVTLVDKPDSIPEVPAPGVTLVFTDGACFGNPGPSGLGVVVLAEGDMREKSEYLGHGTNNIAELTAIMRGLEMAEKNAGEIHVYTDSNYSIGVLGRGWKAKKNTELVESIRKKLNDLDGRVSLVKVKGHAGHAWNERVDELAKQAIENR